MAALVLLGTPAANAAEDGALEYAVKATYLYKFIPFVEWPPSAAAPSSSVHLCVLGNDPVGDMVDRAAAGLRVDDRTIVVRHLRAIDRHSGCHILYVTGSETQSVAQALASVRGTPVLTVTDAAQEQRVKGIINFVVRDDRVRFEIDNEAAAENGLVISSKLLSLAVYVRPRS